MKIFKLYILLFLIFINIPKLLACNTNHLNIIYQPHTPKISIQYIDTFDIKFTFLSDGTFNQNINLDIVKHNFGDASIRFEKFLLKYPYPDINLKINNIEVPTGDYYIIYSVSTDTETLCQDTINFTIENPYKWSLLKLPLEKNFKIRCLAFDKSNTMWIGTDSGLVKYSNGGFEYYNQSNSGLSANKINCISYINNTLLIGTYRGGLCTFDGKLWNSYKQNNSEIASDIINDIKINKDTIWLATDYAGLCRWDGTIFTTFNQNNSSLLSNYINTLDVSRNGNLWMGTDFGLFEYKKGDFRKVTCLDTSINYYFEKQITKVKFDSYDSLWVGALKGIVKQSFDNWINFYSTTPLFKYTNMEVRDIAVDKTGKIWVGAYQSALYTFYQGYWRQHQVNSQGLVTNEILKLGIDSVGNTYIAYSKGIMVVQKNETFSVDQESNNNISNFLKVFPNPCSQFINIENEIPIEVEKIVISDLTGQFLFEQSITNNSNIMLDLSNFVVGSYLLSTHYKNGLVSKKIFVKN